MNTVTKTLAVFSLLILCLSSTVTSVDAAAWVGHKFMLQLPDGTTKELKGAKLHIYHKQHEAEGAAAINNGCYYPPKENATEDWDKKVEAEIGDAFCATPSSCSVIDYGAPYLPADFNDNRDVHPGGGIYEKDNASYKAFYKKTFTEALQGDAPFAYLSTKYEKGNIRGFAGAKWEGHVDYTLEENDADQLKKVGLATKAEIDTLNSNPNWGKNIRYIEGTQRWEEGEVFRDPLGGNVLHAQITWILKAPSIDKPTATLSGKCANNSPGVPTYTYTLSNINLKGQQFADNHLYLRIQNLSSTTNEIKSEFGPPIYENAQFMEYSLIFNTTAPSNNTVTMTVNGAEGIGNKPENKKTVADFVAWVDKKRKVGAILPTWEIATNLRTKTGDTYNTTDYISSTFKPKFETDECGTAPPPTTNPPSAPVCLSIKMQNASGAPVTNFGNLKPGEGVKFACGTVPGITQYKFQVVKFDAQNKQIGTPIALATGTDKTKPNVSDLFFIPTEGGKFLAQCALCQNGKCQAFEPASYVPATSN